MEAICPNGHRVDVLSSDIGQEIRCPTCQQLFVVSSTSSTPGSTTGATSREAVGGASYRPTMDSDRSEPATRHRASGDRLVDRWNLDVLERSRPLGQIFLLLGLFLALLARGWDDVADSHAQSARYHTQNAMDEWNDRWEDRLARVTEEQRSIRAQEELTEDDRVRLDELANELRDLESERERDRRKQLERWSDLERNARETESENRIAKPWREGVFVFGSILFALGLLVIGFTTEGPVRWFCLVLLAIIVFSLYLGGIDWMEAGRSMRNQT